VSAPRPVRIPRGTPAPSTPDPTRESFSLTERRVNAAGTQRAFRFAIFYLIALVVLDLILVALDLTSAEASRPAVESGLQLFIGIAILLAVGSVVFALTPAPRYVDVRPDGTVVVGRWGQQARFPPLESLDAKVVRHYPAGVLSSRPVDVVQAVDRSGRRRTYQVETGLLSPGPFNG
jgi:hypothetical protein